MNANRRTRLTAAEVLRRYNEEQLPSFLDIQLVAVNQIARFDERPLHVASARGDIEEIAALVEAGADVDASGDFGNAVGQGHLEAIGFLLDHGASLSIRNEFGDTPLDVARLKARADIVELLDKKE